MRKFIFIKYNNQILLAHKTKKDVKVIIRNFRKSQYSKVLYFYCIILECWFKIKKVINREKYEKKYYEYCQNIYYLQVFKLSLNYKWKSH